MRTPIAIDLKDKGMDILFLTDEQLALLAYLIDNNLINGDIEIPD